jgi:hypothetical protein
MFIHNHGGRAKQGIGTKHTRRKRNVRTNREELFLEILARVLQIPLFAGLCRLAIV